MPSSRARATKAVKSAIVPSSGCTASWPPSWEPIAQGEPTSQEEATTVPPGNASVFGPFRLTSPMGWIGGRYTTSKPIEAT